GQNPPPGVPLYYYLSQPAKSVKLSITDPKRNVLHEAEGPITPGLHALVWNLRRTVRPPAAGPKGVLPFGAAAPTGSYQAMLAVDGRELARDLKVEADP